MKKITIEKESDGNLNLKSFDNLKSYLLDLLNQNSFLQLNNIEKFLNDINYLKIFNFNEKKKSKVKYSSKSFLVLLSNLNALFIEVNNIFKKDDDFNLYFVSNIFFYSDYALQNYLVNCLSLEENYRFGNKIIEEWYNYNILLLFNQCLIKLKGFFTLEYCNYNNYKNNSFNDLSKKEQNELVGNLAKTLSVGSLKTIFSLQKLDYERVSKNKILVNNINKLYDELVSCDLDLKLRKQKLRSEYKLIIDEFKNNLNNLKQRFSEFTICQINEDFEQKTTKLEILYFNILYKDIVCRAKIAQVNLKLYTYLYNKNSTISCFKDQIFCTNDIDRIFYFIKENYDYLKK